MDIEHEKWADVPGTNGRYRVSTMGLVWSAPNHIHNGKYLKAQLSKRGYYVVSILGKIRTVHQLVLEAFVGPKPAGHYCRHLDGDKTNNVLRNLVWGTPKQNSADATKHGTQHRGERTGGAKLTADQVREMVSAYECGVSQVVLASDFNVAVQTVNAIVKGRNWRHVTGYEDKTARRTWL